MYKNWTDAQREQTSEPLLVKLLKKQVLVPPPPNTFPGTTGTKNLPNSRRTLTIEIEGIAGKSGLLTEKRSRQCGSFFIPPHTRTHNQIIMVLFGSTYTYPQTISMMKLSIDIDPMFITYPSKIIVYMEQYTLFIYEISIIY